MTIPSQTGVHPTGTTAHRFHLLDALRGVAAMLVVLWHSDSYIYPRGNHNTYLAVDFFFCLSGFVIAFSYERRLHSTLRLRDFIAARLIRLYPMFLIGMLAGLAVYVHYNRQYVHAKTLAPLALMQFAMLPDYFIRVTGVAFPFNLAAWSLFFEVIANIFYAILVRKGLAKSWHLVTLIFVSLIILIRQPGVSHHIDVGWSSSPHAIIPGVARVALSFFFGVLLLRLYRRELQIPTNGPTHILAALLLALALITALQSPFPFMQGEVFLFCDILLICPAIVYLGAHVRMPHSWQPACAFLGDVSYPIYLLNAAITPVSQSVFRHIYHPNQPLAPLSQTVIWLFLLSEVAVTTALAHVCVRYLDLPTRQFLKRAYNAA